MGNNQTTTSFKSLLQNPSELTDILEDPGKNGLAFYSGLSAKEKQYVIFTAAAGLLLYGLYIGWRKD